MENPAPNGAGASSPAGAAAQEALRRSEERYRALVEATSQAVWSWSPEGGAGDFAATQRWWEELTGQAPEEQAAKATGWLDVVHPDDRGRAATAWGASLAAGEPYDTEYRVRARSGGWRHIRARGVPVRGPGGSVREWVGTLADVTERKSAEEAARLTEARFRELFEQAPLSIQVLAPDGRTLRVNRAWERLWGLTLEQLADYNVLRDPQLEAKGVAPYLRRAAAGESVAIPAIQYDPEETIPGRTRHPDPRRWVSAVAYPLRGPDGQVHEVVLIHQDETDRHLAEKALDRYRLLSQHARDVVLFVRTDGRIAEANDAAVAAYGYGRDELLGMTIFELRDPATAHLVPAQMFEADSAGVTFETHHRRKDGSAFPVEVSSRGAEVGGERLLLSIIRDVSNRKGAEEAVRRSETRYRKLFEESALAVQVFRPDGRLVRANRAWERLWGARLEQLAGYSLLGDPQLEALGVMPLVRRAFAGEVTEFPPTTYVPDRGQYQGQERSVRSFMYPVKDDSGRVEEVVLLQEDITDQARAMQALREADRRKDEFLAVLAHELRNPLAPIRNGLQLMALAPDDAEAVAEARGVMDRQLTHMVRLIDDLLDVSRMSRGKMGLRRARVRLDDVVGSAVEAAGPLIKAQGHELSVTLPGYPVRLEADLTRLAQVLGNLLTNSARYTPPVGRIWLTAELRGGEAVVSVRDNGIGIPPEALPHVFDMFSQVDRSIERSAGGLGIGLALVKGLVEMHGGTVTAQSEGEGKGSTFTVTLPLPADQSDGEPRTEGRPAPGRGRRVLVVDDNCDGAASMAMMLRYLGNEVRVANDGVEAVELAGAFRPEVILMDVGMPRLNGLDATRRIRGQEWGRAMAIIALTGWGQEGDKDRSREAGCDGHLVKPVTLPDLEKALVEARVPR